LQTLGSVQYRWFSSADLAASEIKKRIHRSLTLFLRAGFTIYQMFLEKNQMLGNPVPENSKIQDIQPVKFKADGVKSPEPTKKL